MSPQFRNPRILTLAVTMFCMLGVLSLLPDPARVHGAPVVQGSVSAAETAPTLLNYQGLLRDQEGALLSGEHAITFRIYDSLSAPAADALWSEEHVAVIVRDGQFSVVLGDITPLDADLFDSPERFIGVTVAPFDEMVPRQRFASVPYALRAAQAANADLLDGKNSTDFANANHDHSTLAAADGTPADAVSVDSAGNVNGSLDVRAADDLSAGDDLFVDDRADIGDDLIVRDNLTVNGDITNFTTTGPHRVDLGVGDTNGSMTLGSTSDRVCFLSAVIFEGLSEDREPSQFHPGWQDGFGICDVSKSGSQWQLEATQSGDNPNTNIFCAATCLRW